MEHGTHKKVNLWPKLIMRTTNKCKLFQLDHLVKSAGEVWSFGQRWWQLPEELEQRAMEGEL